MLISAGLLKVKNSLRTFIQCAYISTSERIANDVLSLSRIQLQVLTIQHVEFDVIEEVQQLAGVFKNELKMQEHYFKSCSYI